MGCGGSTTVERTGGGLVVYGDFFSPDSRTIKAILDIAGIQYKFEVVDHLKGDNKKEEYMKINPT